jgi:hypothetical protein
MKTAEQILEGHVSCNCGPEYKDRGMRAPDCPLCSMHSCYIDAMKEYAKEAIEEMALNIDRYILSAQVHWTEIEKLKSKLQ